MSTSTVVPTSSTPTASSVSASASASAKILVTNAAKHQAASIADLIMMAMTEECCLHFCGSGYGLADFRKMMVTLVEREDSQYSYRNTWVALDGEKVVGAAVSYDGADLHQLRRPFLANSLVLIGKDHSGMDDETQAGELYLDSLAVLPAYRRRGIARRLIEVTCERALKLGLPCVGLLVDKTNPDAESCYVSAGFRHVNDCSWGGHAMKHFQRCIVQEGNQTDRRHKTQTAFGKFPAMPQSIKLPNSHEQP